MRGLELSMAGDEHRESQREGGLRRRRSQHHEDEMTGDEEADAESRQDFGPPRRAFSEPIETLATFGLDNDIAGTPPGSSHSINPRVRFSAQLDGTHDSSSKNGDNGHQDIGSRRLDEVPERHISESVSPTALGGGQFGAVENAQRRQAYGARADPPQRSSTAPVKPRNRGYSLRRSLFNRNIHSQSEDVGTVIELEQAGSSRQTTLVNTRLSPQTKNSKASVTISPVVKEDDLTLTPQTSKAPAILSSLPNYEYLVQKQGAQNGIITRIRSIRTQIRKKILRMTEMPPSKDGRHIDLDSFRETLLIDERTTKPYIDNTIRSSRYTFWSFFPRQLIAQFSKLANFYFLCVSILQMIPNLSTTGRYTTILPLLFFVGISMGKEGYDDLRRSRLDKEENNRTAAVFHPSHLNAHPEDRDSGIPASWTDTKWQDIKVGNILKLGRDEAIPADIALLHADGTNGVAYIETMALDGETNLKSKQSALPNSNRSKSGAELLSSQAHFVVEDPNIDLYSFEGRVTVGEETLPLTNNEIVYRGSVLRNTHQAIGLVIYSGEECKIRMNATKNPRVKAPTLQSMVNKVVIMIVCFVIALSVFNTAAYQIWSERVEERSFYLANAGVAFFPILASFIIMFNTMIPLSLYVSLEIVKLAQMFLLNDVDMYDEESNTPMEPRTSTINEELGQVSYIFSDKTGTLTNNSMRFRKISVAGTAWLHDADLREETAREADKVKLLHKKRTKGKQAHARKSNTSEMATSARKSNTSAFEAQPTPPIAGIARTNSVASHWKSSARPQNTYHGGRTEEMLAYIQHKPLTLFARRAKFFMLSLALCNTCAPEKDVDGNITFQAASPDELALVKAARDLGYLVVDRQSSNMTVRTFPSGSDSDPVYETYEILDVIEFSSARKRMSIIIRMPDNRVCVFCKGADSTLMQLLRLSKLAAEKVAAIEQRVTERKSMEAQQAIRRLSEHKGSSTARTSMSIPRASMGGRPSITRGRLPSIRDDIDQWLKKRQIDGSASPVDYNSIYYSPRPSIQLLSGRQSLARSEGRKSLQKDSADEVVEESLVLNDSAVFERCFQHVNDFASEGLRTLLYGYRYLDEEEYAAWKKSYQEATTSLVDRQFLVEKAGDEIERDFELIGATAIEDKLQKGVPEAIDKLRRANIKLWMLTGDKRETAINIGHSCRLLKDYSTMTILDHEVGGVDQRIAAAIVDINSGTVAHSVIVIDGQTLSMIEAQQIVKDLFFDLVILADSVICCRASPSQKASLVKSIRKKVKKSVTLAIGDGANDIAMIQEAHVGVGITGKEGLQAARTSDYSIAQFRFLLKLLLVHGRWNYIRVCKYTLGTFWKEMLFYLTQALYQRWAGYTGTSLYESWSLSMFNTLFTSLPVIFMGVFEKDLAASTLLAVPELYTKGQRNGGFNIRVYLWWTFMAASDSMVVFFIMLGLYGQALFTVDNGLYAMGVLTFTACVIIISTKVQVLEMHNKSITSVIAILLSVGGWFAFNLALSGLYKDNTIYNVKDGLLDRFGRNALWWLVVILIVTSVVLYELGISSMRAVIWPTDVDIFQAYEQDREIRKRFEEAAAEELQAGWDRGTKKSSVEIAREAALEAAREAEVQEILDRPRMMEEGKTRGRAMASVDFGVRRRHSGSEGVAMNEIARVGVDGGSGSGIGEARPRKSVEIQELFSKGFGSVRKGQTLE